VLSRSPGILYRDQWLWVPLGCMHGLDKVKASTVTTLTEMQKTIDR
jgi:hypothetical protein